MCPWRLREYGPRFQLLFHLQNAFGICILGIYIHVNLGMQMFKISSPHLPRPRLSGELGAGSLGRRSMPAVAWQAWRCSVPWWRSLGCTYRHRGCLAERWHREPWGQGGRAWHSHGAALCHQLAWSGWKKGTDYLPDSHSPSSFPTKRAQ